MIKSYDQGLRNCFLVRPEHLNHEGHLFGGVMMAEIDTTAYCLLRQEYEDKSFVTRAAEISFDRPARLGDVVLFEAHILNVGSTSVQVEVTGLVDGVPICSTCMTYVNVGPDGKKAPL
jgi:uncharacterized protein (TIGR00369 family)